MSNIDLLFEIDELKDALIGRDIEIESLRQQLAECQAALVLKDDALTRVCGHIGLYNLFSCVGGDSFDPECAELNAQKCREIAKEAITIQPGTEALEKWLGEPVGVCKVGAFNTVRWLVESLPNGTTLHAKPKGIY